MTYSLAQAIATRSVLRVADPSLVAKAFGLNARQISESEILSLAAKLSVSKILVGTVLHDRNGHSAVRMRIITQTAAGHSGPKVTEQVRTYAGNSFSDTSPPIAGFRALRDTDLKDAGIRLRAQPIKAPVRNQPTLPYSVDELLAPESAEDAVPALQLIGVLVPPELTSRTRDLMFERSLVLLDLVNTDSPNHDLLTARALL